MKNQEIKKLEKYLSQTNFVAWDGCHKIYLINHSERAEKLKTMGYQIFSSLFYNKHSIVLDCYNKSCSLRFIDFIDFIDGDTQKHINIVYQQF